MPLFPISLLAFFWEGGGSGIAPPHKSVLRAVLLCSPPLVMPLEAEDKKSFPRSAWNYINYFGILCMPSHCQPFFNNFYPHPFPLLGTGGIAHSFPFPHSGKLVYSCTHEIPPWLECWFAFVEILYLNLIWERACRLNLFKGKKLLTKTLLN